MKKNALLLLLIGLTIVSCNNSNSSPSEKESQSEVSSESILSSDELSSSESSEEIEFNGDIEYEITPHDYIDERDYTYENKLDKPSNIVHNIEDLQDIVDYYAFYKIEKFQVKLDNYQYSTEKKDIASELNYLYWHSELINGVMGFNAVDIGNNVWEFTYTIYQNAFRDSTPYFKNWDDLLYVTPTSTRDDTFDDFETDSELKPICDVSTTQQLWFAAEHDYRINCLPGSKAEEYYLKAKDLLRDIIDDSMDYLTKLSTIYDYIHETTTYDYKAAYEDEDTSPDPSLYPDTYAATCKCYFLEGFFDNHLVVCDGFSKVYTLLGKMEGLDIVRGSGTDDTRWITREVPGHAYCFVKYEDDWFLSDLTWGQYQNSDKRSCNYHHYFLAPHTYIDPYMSSEWPELGIINSYSEVETNPVLDYFQNRQISYNDKTYSLVVSNNNSEQLEALFHNFKGKVGRTEVTKTQSYINILATSDEGFAAAIDKAREFGLQFTYFDDPNFPSQYELLIMSKN